VLVSVEKTKREELSLGVLNTTACCVVCTGTYCTVYSNLTAAVAGRSAKYDPGVLQLLQRQCGVVVNNNS
jgi:hypothetical protein